MTDKECKVCEITKPPEDFRKKSRVCRLCEYEKHKEWVKKNPENRKRNVRKYAYGHCTNYQEFEDIWEDTTHCQCCGAEFNSTRRLTKCMDHVDAGPNSYVRGIVCGNCNIGIGCLGDTLDGVFNAINYLDRG